jgi:hypothetical protein
MVNVFEPLVARAMDSVRAIREESQHVDALVTCGFFYIVGTTRNQTAQVISEECITRSQEELVSNSAERLGSTACRSAICSHRKLTGLLGSPLEHFRCARCGGSSINQVRPLTASYENATADGSCSCALATPSRFTTDARAMRPPCNGPRRFGNSSGGWAGKSNGTDSVGVRGGETVAEEPVT